ncbi:MAG: hypothetical protein IJN65_02945 [Clostridia bacterium]|nr:hypothetical protein [Clostridia bacterium]
MKDILLKFKELKINKSQLKKEIGEDLYNVDCPSPILVNIQDLSKVIRSYIDKKISLQQLVDWVNIVWFTELFELPEKESDSIISVLEVLETLDEDEVTICAEDFSKMLISLSNNNIYIQ